MEEDNAPDCDDWSCAFDSFAAGLDWMFKHPDATDDEVVDACLQYADRVAKHDCKD